MSSVNDIACKVWSLCRLWLSVVRASAHVVEERSWECELTLGCGQVWEYLYHNHTRINHITKPVAVSPVSYNTVRCR